MRSPQVCEEATPALMGRWSPPPPLAAPAAAPVGAATAALPLMPRPMPSTAQRALLLLGLMLAALAAPAAAQVAETVSVDSCQAALWSGLPLAKQQTPSASYDPTVGVGSRCPCAAYICVQHGAATCACAASLP